MANSSLKSPRKNLILGGIALFIFVFALQLALSYVFSTQLPKVTEELSSAFGHKIQIDIVAFSFFKGLRLSGVSIFYGNEKKAAVYFRDVNIFARILPLLSGKLSINKVNINEALFLSKKEKEGVNLQIIFSDIYKKIPATKPLPYLKVDTDNISINIGEAKVIPKAAYGNAREIYLLLKNARISTYRATKVNFRSQVYAKYQIPKELYISRFLSTKEIIQDAKYSMQGNIENNDMKLEMCELSLGEEQVIFTGKIIDFAGKNPRLEIASVPSSTSLENLSFLKNNFSANGSMFFSLNIQGLLDNPKLEFSGKLDNGSLTYHMVDGNIVSIRRAIGKIEYKNDSLTLENMFLNFNNLPIVLTLTTSISRARAPDIYFRLALVQDFLNAHGLPIEKLESTFKGRIQNNLQGDLEIKTLYKRKNLALDMQANFSNVDFDYYNLGAKHFKAKNIELLKKSKTVIQKLNFTDFDSIVSLTEEQLAVKNAKFNAYQGTMTGGVNIYFAKRKPQLHVSLRGQGLDVKTLMRDVRITGKLSSGIMDLNAIFDNEAAEFVEGRCYIKNGVIDLSTLSNAIKFPPLDNTHFGILHIYFAIFKDRIIVRGVKLLSPEIKLNGFWDTNGKVSGILNIKAESGFLRKSEQFRRLLDFTQISSPYINFRFLLGGIPQAIRFMWLKGEFKNKLEDKLPKGVKNSIQANMDKSIEELAK